MRSSVLAVLIVAYQVSFTAVHARIGAPAFLPGLVLCILAAALLGVRGALAVIFTVGLVDRIHAMALPQTFENGIIAGIMALLVKLVLAGGLGLVLDSRRRTLFQPSEHGGSLSAIPRTG